MVGATSERSASEMRGWRGEEHDGSEALTTSAGRTGMMVIDARETAGDDGTLTSMPTNGESAYRRLWCHEGKETRSS